MKLRYIAAGAVLVVAAAGGGFAYATIGGHDADEGATPVPSIDNDNSLDPACGDLAGVCSTQGEATPPEIVVGEADGNDSTGIVHQSEGFVGSTAAEATDLAEDEGRPWRIGREDDEEFVLTDDLVAGRVTLEIDDGIVTSVSIESDISPPPTTDIVEDPARADLISAAVKRLLTVDNSFGGVDVFDDIRVASVIGSDPDQPLRGLDLELIAATLQELGTVRFVDDADAEIGALFSESPAGVAVVSVDRVVLLDDRAEVELRLWCGSLCGVFLTYEAAPDDGRWDITGTTGPIAVS